jgi:hypothetical protein
VLLVSFLLVIVATIFLLSGLFLTKDLPLIFVSIGCSALAGLVLVIAVLKSRPRAIGETEPSGPRPDTVAADLTATDTEVVHEVAPEVSRAPLPTGRAPERGRFAGRAFPIPDYDKLEVVEVLPLLGDLEPPELEMVRQREASGRAHPWVLARVDALLEADSGEWGPAEEEQEEEEEAGAGWAEPQPEWAGGGSDWSASDFPMEATSDVAYEPGRDAGYDAGYDELEVMRDFPIDRYDELRANDILPLLSELDPEDLKMVREEEQATKARTSVLSRIDVLLAREGSAGAPASRPAKAASRPKGASRAALALPIADYDSLTVAQITAQIPSLSIDELKAVRSYEKRHKARSGVLQRIESVLARYR